MNKVVYLHRRNDDSSIFYVGMGSEERPYSKRDRNRYWNNIVNKYGYSVEVVDSNLSVKDAFELEMFLISEIGRKDLGKGKLVNLTNGGDGCLYWSDERKKSMIELNRKKMKPVSQYDIDGNLIATYRSTSDASKKTCFSRQQVRDCSKGKINTCMGYVFVYSNEKYIHDKKRWDNGSECMMGGKNPNAKLVLNSETGIFYDSMSMAFNSQTKYKESAFRAKLSGQNKNNTNYKYV